MRLLVGLLCAVGVAATSALVGPATGTSGATGRGSGVPPGFVPSSTSWTSQDRGWVLGVAPCATGTCPAMVRTWDGGATWWPSGTPDVRVPLDNKRIRVHFANGRDGMVTDGSRLFATHTAGLLWRRVDLSRAGTDLGIAALASDERSLYAVVASDSGTRLFSSPRHVDRWRPVSDVELPDRGAGDVVAHGDTVYVALSAVHRSHGYWVGSGGRWHGTAPPCGIHADPDLGLAPGQAVYALCTYNPGMGYAFKDVWRSASGERFTLVGSAPDRGITTGFAAASPSTVAVTATGGGTALLHRGVRRGADWHTPFVLGGAPMYDLHFTDERHGALVHGGPQWDVAGVYLTSDGAATWTPVDLGTR